MEFFLFKWKFIGRMKSRQCCCRNAGKTNIIDFTSFEHSIEMYFIVFNIFVSNFGRWFLGLCCLKMCEFRIDGIFMVTFGAFRVYKSTSSSLECWIFGFSFVFVETSEMKINDYGLNIDQVQNVRSSKQRQSILLMPHAHKTQEKNK